MTDARLVPFLCPMCKGELRFQDEPTAYQCPSCVRTFPVRLSIPDFRIWPDPYIDIADDWEKGARVRREAAAGGFRSMLERYWALTSGTPAPAAARFIRYAMVGVARGRSALARVSAARGRPLDRSDSVLDLGCGTGGLVVAASSQAGTVIGVDIAARWLVVAATRLEEARTYNAGLVCACAEHLPFPDESFSVVIANDVLEHSQHQRELLQEVRRILAPDGVLLLTTQNRWSLLGEPHVRVWGVGFLPRRWMARYVWLFRRVPYRWIRLVSPKELEQLLRATGLCIVERLVPRMTLDEVEGLAARDRQVVALYDLLARVPIFRPILHWFGPALQVVARGTERRDDGSAVATARTAR